MILTLYCKITLLPLKSLLKSYAHVWEGGFQGEKGNFIPLKPLYGSPCMFPLSIMFQIVYVLVQNATNALSIINLQGTKVLWVSEIIDGSMVFSLFVKIFYMNFYRTLHKLKSMYSVILVGHFVFGIKAYLYDLVEYSYTNISWAFT
jgi:hypothetical protein